MYFEDLTQYSYLPLFVRPGLLNIGWLDARHPFPTAEPTQEIAAALWRFCRHSVAQARGFHECEICTHSPDGLTVVTHGGETLRLGMAEIRSFGNEGRAFAAPDLIFHYVIAHHYAPPDAFVASVISGPQPGTAEYERSLQNYLASPAPPPRPARRKRRERPA